jgi:phage gp36-like protein
MTYATAQNIYDVYGETNVRKWADLDNDGDEVKIEARIDSKLALAESFVNGKLRNTRYEIPITGTVPLEITDLTAKQAGAYLYEGRGMEDAPEEGGRNPIQAFKKEVKELLSEIRRGRHPLDLPFIVQSSPEVIKDAT